MSIMYQPFKNQRMSGAVTVNPGYPGSSYRREAAKTCKGEPIYAVLSIAQDFDDFLYHQYYLRDMAYTRLQAGDVEGAMGWLAKIGEDK